MIIGSFKYTKAQDTYLGDIVTLNFRIEGVAFKPNPRKADKEPDYRIVAATPSGSVELGAGWKRTSDKGMEFVSVSLDAPLLTTPFNAALFLEADGKSATLVWSRPKAKEVKKLAPTKKAA
jgi:uncharacterized protein (DUF736 family)